jgi:hypothetical protein
LTNGRLEHGQLHEEAAPPHLYALQMLALTIIQYGQDDHQSPGVSRHHGLVLKINVTSQRVWQSPQYAHTANHHGEYQSLVILGGSAGWQNHQTENQSKMATGTSSALPEKDLSRDNVQIDQKHQCAVLENKSQNPEKHDWIYN